MVKQILPSLILAVLALTAWADPVQFSPGDTEFRMRLSGLTLPNADGIVWCANYFENPGKAMTCIDGDFAGPNTPILPVYPAEVADQGYVFDLCFRWHIVPDDFLTSCASPGAYFAPMIETYRSDSNFDGSVGGPDYIIFQGEIGCGPEGCGE